LIGPPRTPGSDCASTVLGNASAAANSGAKAIARSFFIRFSLKLQHIFLERLDHGRCVGGISCPQCAGRNKK
jgi:hypothetical protein